VLPLTYSFLLLGFVRDDTWNFTTGDTLYVGLTAGVVSNTLISTAGDQARIVGKALSDDVIWFSPDSTIVEYA